MHVLRFDISSLSTTRHCIDCWKGLSRINTIKKTNETPDTGIHMLLTSETGGVFNVSPSQTIQATPFRKVACKGDGVYLFVISSL